MKNRLYTLLYITAIILTACDSDLEKVRYNASEAQSAILQDIDSSYILHASEAEHTAITFQWKKPIVNYPASLTTDLQIDIDGEDFSHAITLASTKTDSVYSAITSDLNHAVLQLREQYGLTDGTVSVTFRLSSSLSSAVESLYSNTVRTNITPYE